MKLNWKTLFLLTTCSTLGLITTAKAQIIPDNSLGAESSTVGQPNQAINGIPINQIDQINGGARRGGNLFHSFGEFNVNAGRGAYFSNPDGVGNIFTRVTGVNRSNILGTLGVLGNANLFLINPNGIFFGPNASLDVRGSFLGSSANSLLFDNGFEFSATNPQAPPLLTVNIPIGLRFRDNPGEIRVQGLGQTDGLAGIAGRFSNPTLEVPIGQNLTLVGGNVSLDGGVLQATGGRVQLGGLTAAGTVGINANQTLSFPNGVQRGDVSLTNSSGINVIANQLGGGSIDINARNIRIFGESLLTDGIFRNLGTVNNRAGNITLNATVETRINQSRIENNVNTGTIANSGNIGITTGSFVMNLGELNSTNFGSGRAGDISLNARDEVSITNNTNFFSNVTQNGQAGDITIKAGSFSLLGGSQLQSGVLEDGQGNGGNVTIDVPTGIVRIAGRDSDRNRSGIFNDVESGARGNGGNIIINAGSIFTDDAVLNTRNAGNGLAGDISLNARDQISIVESRIFAEGNQGGIFIGNQLSPASVIILSTNTDNSLSTSTSNGRAGDISIQATGAVEFDGNVLFSNVLSGAQNGQAGNINIKAGSFSLLNGAQLQSGVVRGGQGNGGNVRIDVPTGIVRIAGRNSNRNPSGIFNDVESGAIGNGGDITINAASIFTDDAELRTTNAGDGFAGDISLNARDEVSIANNSNFFSNVTQNGRAGNINIRAGSFSLLGAQLQSGVVRGGQGNGGNVTIDVPTGIVRIAGRNSNENRSGIFNDVQSGASGNAGNIIINAGSIFTDDAFLTTENAGNGSAGDISLQVGDAIALTNGSVIISSIFGRGNAGDVTLRAENGDISLAGGSDIFSTVESGGMGNAGKIDIITRNLSLTDGSLINSSTFGRGNAGNVSLQVGDAIALSNSSVIASIVGRAGEGIGGDIDIRGRSLTLTEGSQIDTVLFREGDGLSGGIGRAGNIDINATDFVNIFGVGTGGFSSGLLASAERGTTAISPQAAGNINLTTGDFRIADGAVVDALTSNSGNAGNITINANTFTASGGGQVITTTRSSGNAGNINLNVRDRITISGSDPNYNQRVEQAAQSGLFDDIVNNQGAASGIFANTARNSTGNGGNITIQPLQNRLPTIAISDGAEVTVASQGQGQGGEISITGNSLSLDRGIINASTASGDGGNINLRLRNFIRLRNESLISASAGGNGNGGNITINSPFIVAFPRNNDITANAGRGSGGRVTINATLFGINPLSAEDLRRLRPDDLDPRQIPTSDITAISRDNPSLSRPVQVNSPDVDPSRGLVELPEAVTDPTQKVAENPCRQGIGNEFFVTGRGGLPTTPNQPLNSDNVRVDLLQPVASSGNSRATIKPATTITARRVPAQGWIFNDKGQVVLTAYDPTNTGSQRPFSTAAACPAR